MKKLLLTLGTILLISGCSQSELQKCIDRNITLYLNLESYSLAIYSLKLDTGISVSEYKEFLSSNKLENFTNSTNRTVNFHIKLDTQLVKSTGKYVKYNQGTKGMISWKEYTNYDDGTFITNAYLLDRTDLSLLIITGHSHKGSSSLRYTCNKKEIKF